MALDDQLERFDSATNTISREGLNGAPGRRNRIRVAVAIVAALLLVIAGAMCIALFRNHPSELTIKLTDIGVAFTPTTELQSYGGITARTGKGSDVIIV